MDSSLTALNERLNTTFARFVQVAKQLDPALHYQIGSGGEWTPKDVVAHLIGWDKALLTFIMDPEKFVPPNDIDEFNAHSVNTREKDKWPQVMVELEATFLNLSQAIMTVTPQMRIYARVKSWLLGRIEDYELHTSQIQYWLV